MTRSWSFSKRSRAFCAAALAFVVLGACSDERPDPSTGPGVSEAFDTYVAIGTSITMGVQSDGVLYSTQMQDWTALLAHQAFATYTQPLIQAPGCFSPFIAPLQLGRRHSGASAPGIVPADTVCALFPDITLPRNDVGIDGASTYDAHRVTPETTFVETQKRRRQYRIVLPPGKSQVTAMMMQNPTLVSVELGANEVLGVAQTGLLVPAAAYRPSNIYTYVPNSVWQPVYAQVLDSVRKTGAKAVLVSVPNVTGIVSLRSGDELWQNQAEFANFGVVVNADCQGNTNQIFVPIKVATAVATARATGTAYNLSCTDAPGTQDQILTPADVTTITAVVAGMNSYIQAQASANGWAYIDIAAVLQKAVANRGPYSVAKQLGCVSPYGQYVSLDGVHPNVQGHQELANAAAEALNATYGWTIPTNPQPVLPAAQLCP